MSNFLSDIAQDKVVEPIISLFDGFKSFLLSLQLAFSNVGFVVLFLLFILLVVGFLYLPFFINNRFVGNKSVRFKGINDFLSKVLDGFLALFKQFMFFKLYFLLQ